jgi:hypothetical protein
LGVRTHEPREEPRPRRRGPSVLAATLLALFALLGLLANGRPIGTGAPPWLASSLDATGVALVGKLFASIGGAAAALFLFLAVGRRRPLDDARTAALLLAFGTTVWAAAQSFSVTPFSTALVAAGTLVLVLAEDDAALGPRAGLPLALAAALQPADLMLALVLAFVAVIRRPRQIGLWALWSAPGIAVGLCLGMARAAGGSGSALRLDETWAKHLAAIWVSPAAGLLVFAPVVLVALVGLARALRREDAPLAAGCGLAFLAHGLVIAARPLIGGSWGPRDWTDALPIALLFLPEGLDVLKGAGTALAFVSVAVQLLGAFTYDERWDRLFAPTPEKRAVAVWDAARSPIPFQLGERVWITALPQVHEGKLRVAEHRIVLGGPEGARVSAMGSRLVVEGADPTLGNVHLQGGARAQGDRIRLESAGDAIFFRVRPESRIRQLEVRITGRGQGTLALGEASFWNPEPRIRERAVSGDFHLRFPYHYADSGGGDLRLSLQSGSADVSSVRLVPPTEPENVIRLPGS